MHFTFFSFAQSPPPSPSILEKHTTQQKVHTACVNKTNELLIQLCCLFLGLSVFYSKTFVYTGRLETEKDVCVGGRVGAVGGQKRHEIFVRAGRRSFRSQLLNMPCDFHHPSAHRHAPACTCGSGRQWHGMAWR
jgi:hypothetical protein